MAFFPIVTGFPLMVIIIWTGFCGLFLFFLHGVIYKRVKRKYDIINNGLKGSATILTITEHPEFKAQYYTSDYFITMKLQVKMEGQAAFTIEKKERITQLLYQKFKVGSVIPLRKGWQATDEILYLMDEISLGT